jgi:hypothetical protein
MSGLTAFLIVAVLLTVALAGVCREGRRIRVADARRDQILRDSCQPAVTVPCAPDNEAGVNLADADECALTYSLPEFDPSTDPQWAAGRARLLAAIRDHQKGDQA